MSDGVSEGSPTVPDLVVARIRHGPNDFSGRDELDRRTRAQFRFYPKGEGHYVLYEGDLDVAGWRTEHSALFCWKISHHTL